jgi:polygalacturonase
LTPSYSRNIRVRDLRITAPIRTPGIGNTDGVNLDSCRDAVVEHLYINNSDDGVCMKSGLDGYGMNLAIPTEDVLVRNVSCDPASRCGFAIGSEMSGGVRNVTFRDSVCRVRTCIV